jgi:hypothetical protein
MNKQLKTWCFNQKKKFKRGGLSNQEIKKLEAIKGWSWDSYLNKWEDKAERFKEFMLVNDKIPGNIEEYGDWVLHQKSCYHRGEMSDERIEYMESIRFWTWNTLTFERWLVRYNTIYNRVNVEGAGYPKQKQGEYNPDFRWCNRMRGDFKKGKLSQLQIEKLDELKDWRWTIDYISDWFSICHSVIDDVNNKGMKLTKYKTWIDSQKHKFKKNELTKEQIDHLNKVNGFIFGDAKLYKWTTIMNEVLEYYTKNGKLPTQSVGNIGWWVSGQRYYYKKGKLSDEQIKTLDDNFGEWLVPDGRFYLWKDGFDKFYEYYKTNNKLPTQASGSVGRWLYTQRGSHKKGLLNKRKLDCMNMVDCWMGKR